MTDAPQSTPTRSATHTAAVTLPPAVVLLPLLVDHLGPKLAAVVFVAVTLIPAALTRLVSSSTFDALLTTVLPFLAPTPRKKGQ